MEISKTVEKPQSLESKTQEALPAQTESSESLDKEASVESVVNDVLNEIITLIESSSPSSSPNKPETILIEESKNTSEKIEQKIEPQKPKTYDDKNDDKTIENCVFNLKQLTHTFIKSHLFKNDSNSSSPSSTNSQIEENIKKSFSSLFYSNQIKSLFNLNDDGYLVDESDYLTTLKLQNTSAQTKLTDAINSIHLLISNENKTNDDEYLNEEETFQNLSSTLSNIYLIPLKHDCLNYLQSFQILNKLIVKMFFFPREQKRNVSITEELKLILDEYASDDQSNETDDCSILNAKKKLITRKLSEITRIIDSFEDWLKDLFVISCTTEFNYNNNQLQSASKLFEFQSITLNTIIELIQLSESVNAHYDIKDPNSFLIGSNKTSTSILSDYKLNSIYKSLYENNSTLFNLLINGNQKFSLNTNEKPTKNTCLIQTIFSKSQIEFIYNRSQFGYLTAKMLWSHLSPNAVSNNSSEHATYSSVSFSNPASANVSDKRAAILFCLLHETLPNNLCEDIISQNLALGKQFAQPNSFSSTNECLITPKVGKQVDALKRFTRLWHWSREMNLQEKLNNIPNLNDDLNTLEDIYDLNSTFTLSSSPIKIGRINKTFERSLLIVLDMLNNRMTPAPLAKLIQEWLISCICDYNDLPRLLDILLVSLLHPNTARVSVQFFLSNLIATSSSLLSALPFSMIDDENNEQNELNYESKVYAISNEGGNVKYHVNDAINKQANSGSAASTPNQQLFLLTSLDQSALPANASASTNNLSSNNSVTKPLRNANVELPLSILNAASLSNQGQNIKLRINPFLVKNSPGLNGSSSNNLANGVNQRGSVPNAGFSLDDYDDELDQMDYAKNARLLENYKAIKAGQLKDKEKMSNLASSSSGCNNPSPQLSPSNQSSISSSIKKSKAPVIPASDGTSTATSTAQENIPKILIDEQENANTTAQNETSNFQDAFFNLDDENNSDDENDEDEEDDDGFDTESYNSDEDAIQYGEDNSSRTTELTSINSQNFLNTNANASLEEIGMNGSPSSVKRIKKPNGKEKGKKEKKKAKLVGNESSPTLNIKNVDELDKRASLDSNDLSKFDKSLSTTGAKTNLSSSVTEVNSISLIKSGLDLNLKSTTSQRLLAKSSAAKELIVDAQNPLDLNYAHMLIYTNYSNMQSSFNTKNSNKLNVSSSSNSSYDHVRTLFILKCIEQMLNKCTKEFLLSITSTYLTSSNSTSKSTSTTASSSVHNEKLLDLIVRHLRSIYGQNFYSSSSGSSTNSFDLNRLNFSLNNTTYIEAITMVLLFYIRSYYMPSSFTLKMSTGSSASANTAESNSYAAHVSTKSCNKAQTLDSTNRNKLNIEKLITKSASASSLHSAVNTAVGMSDSSSTSSSSKNNTISSNSSTISHSPSSIKNLAQLDNSFDAYPKLELKSGLKNEPADRDERLFNENRNVQINALQILSKLIKELSNICQSSRSLNNSNYLSVTSASFYQSIIDLLDRCKLQKTLLHCFFSTIHNPAQNTLAQCILSNSIKSKSATLFNDYAQSNESFIELGCKKQIQYNYVSELVNALENLIELENLLNNYQTITRIQKGIGINSISSRVSNSSSASVNTTADYASSSTAAADDDLLLTLNKKATLQLNSSKLLATKANENATQTNMSALQSTRYIQTQPICNQSMFISTVLYYLKHMNLVDYHLAVLKLVRNSLPSSGSALKSITTCIVEQLCRNLFYITNGGSNSGSSSGSYMLPIITYMTSISASINIPDLVVSILKQLSYLLHYCLLNYHSSLSLTSITNELGINAFNLNTITESQFKLYKQFQAENDLNQTLARDCLINILPSILSSMTQVWQRCNLLLNSNGSNGFTILFETSSQPQNFQQQYTWILGHPLTIKKCITDMLNPIAQNHSIHFLTAVGSVWGEKRKKSRVTQEHRVIIELVRSLKSFPLPVIVQNITDILKQTNQNNNKDKVNLGLFFVLF